MTEKTVIGKCKKLFARWGIPEIVRTDPGTQFFSQFNQFAKEYDFKHVQNSPKYSQSNGAVEAAVKTAKNILKKCDYVNVGLLSYRSTPLENGFSPDELMTNRKIRSLVPTISKNLGTFKNHKLIAEKEINRKTVQEKNYNKRHRVKKLSELNIGEKVWVFDMQTYAEVTEKCDIPNSYIIKTEKGSIIQRNRWHLIPAPYKNKMQVAKYNPPLINYDDNSVNVNQQQCINDKNVDLCPDKHTVESVMENQSEGNAVNSDHIVDENDGIHRSTRERYPNVRLKDYYTGK